MITLSNEKPFARGGRRECYLHPNQSDYCIKVCRADKQPEDLRQADPWYKRLRSADYYDENIKDYRLIKKIFERIGDQQNQILPLTQGLIQTDLGQGLVTELVKDTDQSISVSAKQYIYENGLTDELETAIQELSETLISHLIYFRDPFPHNVVIQRTNGSLCAKIVDGLGSLTIQRLGPLSPTKLIEKKIRKKIARLKSGLKRTEQDRENGVTPSQNGFLEKPKS